MDGAALTNGQRTAPRPQLRLAAAFTGGVSLAVWMGGMAREMNLLLAASRMNRGEQPPATSAPGARIGDISSAVGALSRGAHYGIPSGFGGHGIGRQMHEDPHVPNEGRPGRGMRLRPGLALAIEPMLIAGGSDDYVVAPDGWALRTADGTRAAHVEHSVAITEDGPRILTLP